MLKLLQLLHHSTNLQFYNWCLSRSTIMFVLCSLSTNSWHVILTEDGPVGPKDVIPKLVEGHIFNLYRLYAMLCSCDVIFLMVSSALNHLSDSPLLLNKFQKPILQFLLHIITNNITTQIYPTIVCYIHIHTLSSVLFWYVRIINCCIPYRYNLNIVDLTFGSNHYIFLYIIQHAKGA